MAKKMNDENKSMSPMEKEEAANRFKAMTKEEMILAVKVLPSDYMWDELRRRDEINRSLISQARSIFKIEA